MVELEIKIGDRSLDLYPDQKLKYNFLSDIFSTDVIPGDYTYPFSFPPTPNNNITFEYAARMDRPGRLEYSTPVKVFLYGNFFTDAILEIEEADPEEGYSAQLVSGLNYLKSQIENQKLTAVDLGNVNNSNMANLAKLCAENEYDGQFYLFQFPPVYHPNFYLDVIAAYSGYVNYWDVFTQEFKVNVSHSNTSLDNQYNLVPFPYLIHIYKQVLDSLGFSDLGNFTSENTIKKLLVYNNRSLDRIESKYYCFVATSANMGLDGGPNEYIPIEYYRDVTPYSDPDDVFDTLNHKYIVPEDGKYEFRVYVELAFNSNVGLSLMVDGVQQASAGVTSGDFSHRFVHECQAGEEIEIKVWAGSETTLQFSELEVVSISRANLNVYAQEVVINNHVPDITINEFFSALKKAFNLSYEIDTITGKFTTKFVKEILANDEYEDWTGLLVGDPVVLPYEYSGYKFNFDHSGNDEFTKENFFDPNSYDFQGEIDTAADLPAPAKVGLVCEIRNRNTFHITKIHETFGLSWDMLGDSFRELYIDSGGKEIKPALSPLFNWFDGTYNKKWIVPRIKQKGSSTVYETGMNPFDFQLMIYHGLHNNMEDQLYPFASNTNFDVNNNDMNTNELNWRSSDNRNMYSQYWESYVSWLKSTKVFKAEFKLKYIHVLNYQKNRKIMLHGTKFIIKKLSIDLPISSVAEAEIVRV